MSVHRLRVPLTPHARNISVEITAREPGRYVGGEQRGLHYDPPNEIDVTLKLEGVSPQFYDKLVAWLMSGGDELQNNVQARAVLVAGRPALPAAPIEATFEDDEDPS